MPLQDIIHKFTEGTGARLLTLVLVFFGMVGLAIWYDLAAFKNLSTIEGMDNAQLARNLSEGQGFTTGFVRPFSLHLVKRHRADGDPLLADRHPDLANAPIYPALLVRRRRLLRRPAAESTPRLRGGQREAILAAQDRGRIDRKSVV